MSAGLHELAKKHLGFSSSYPNSLIPKTYIATLEQHLAKYPFDDNYSLVKQAKKGYGILTCNEEGCGVEIALTPIIGKWDGGKQGGIGSLEAFHKHIETHPTHKKSCLRRRAQEAKLENQSDAKDGTLYARDGRVDALIKVGNPSQSSSRRVSEMYPPASPKFVTLKRVSDVAFHQSQLEDAMDVDDDDEPVVVHVSKKLKQEASHASIPKSPLATKTNTVVPARSYADLDEAREHLQDVVKDFMDTQTLYDRALRKKNKTKADTTRLAKLKTKLDELRRQKDDLKSRIPTMGSPKKLGRENSALSVTADHAMLAQPEI
ncbi:hypothetical protein CVT24_002546 [Panaeolus cyanescens]|uniref:Uncharacterized protein n=1 Tax=Panaeolus cyanescens TaxID=181874 RepID=A0A409WPQ7_9AGAR|nr:hypothetical protein CVT24_002546 [Panaeolus cyanescens]